MKETSIHTEKAHDEFTLKEKFSYAFIGIVLLGGSFYLGRKLIRNAVSTTEEKKTFTEGSPAMYAQQMKMAFENDGWWGTDTAALRQTIQAVPSRTEFKKIIDSYQRLYSRSLMMDMKDKLKTTVYNEMLAIISAKPVKGSSAVLPALTDAQYQSWAERLKAAFDMTYGPFPGTDENAIKAVFLEIPSKAAYQQVALAYKKAFGNDLDSDLGHELEFWEKGPMMDIINKKP
jgi:hypothetical protein